MPVAAKEGREPQHVGIVRRPDDERPAVPGLDQRHPAQDQRARDPLAEAGLGDEQRPQPGRRDQDRLDLALRMPVDQRRPPRERAYLGGELPRPLLRDRLPPPEAVALADGDLPLEHHEHAGARFPGVEELLPVREMHERPEVPDALDLGRGQLREGFRLSGMQGLGRGRFGFEDIGHLAPRTGSDVKPKMPAPLRQPCRIRGLRRNGSRLLPGHNPAR